MKFNLLSIVFNPLDRWYGFYLCHTEGYSGIPGGLLCIEYADDGWDWDFLFIHYIYERFIARN